MKEKSKIRHSVMHFSVNLSRKRGFAVIFPQRSVCKPKMIYHPSQGNRLIIRLKTVWLVDNFPPEDHFYNFPLFRMDMAAATLTAAMAAMANACAQLVGSLA